MKKFMAFILVLVCVFLSGCEKGATYKKEDLNAADIEKGEINTEETIIYNGKEYKKSELCNATLQWLNLSEEERMFSSYLPPEFMIFEEN